MRRARRLRTLSLAEIALLAEAMGALAMAALMIAFVPFRRIAARAGRGPYGRPGDAAPAIGPVRWAIRACARRVPWRAKCFEQGLAAQWMLRRRGLATTLHYGVRRSPENGLAAHVWVRAGPVEVIGCENSGDFTEIARFPKQER